MNIIDLHLSFNGTGASRNKKDKDIVLHHEAGNAGVKEMNSYHKNGNGWIGIGYHYVVDKDGTIYYGRPEDWKGAHTYGFNDKIGICAIGNFEEEKMSDKQRDSIIELIKFIWDNNGRGKLFRHRDLDATACPGRNYPYKYIVNAASKPGPEPEPSPSPEKKRYRSLKEMPEYYQSEIGQYISDGSLKGFTDNRGLYLSEDMVRILSVVMRQFGGLKE